MADMQCIVFSGVLFIASPVSTGSAVEAGFSSAQGKGSGPVGAPFAEAADLALHNGQIYAPQGWEESHA